MQPSCRTEPENRPSFISTQVTEARCYYLDLDPQPVGSLVVVCGGCERMRSDYMIDRTDFPFSAIEFIAEGTGGVELSGTTYQLAPGMAFTYGPRMAHRIWSDPATPMLKYFVVFAEAADHELLAGSALAAGGVVQLSSPQEVIEVFELLQREGMSHARFGPQICASLLSVLAMKIDQHAAPYGEADFRALETYERAKRIIEERFLSLRSAEEAARACHIDASYLCRLFRRFGRLSPYRFITKLKMNRAAALLLDNRMMVKEVADALGFADAFHFSRSFKRVYGISPERFMRHQSRISSS